MRQVLRKMLSNWVISQLWDKLLTKCRPDEILPAPPPDDDDHGGSPDAMLSAQQREAAASTAASDDQASSEATSPTHPGSTRNCGNICVTQETPDPRTSSSPGISEFSNCPNLRACIDFRELGTSHVSGNSHSPWSGTSAVPTPTKLCMPSTAAPGVSPGLCFDHRDDHLLPVDSSHHSLLTASNSNREFLARAASFATRNQPTALPVARLCKSAASGIQARTPV
jgi:hypothetical protein